MPGLDEAELRAFLMAQPQVVGDQRLVHAAERALSKLIAAMPVPLRERAASIRQRLLVDTTTSPGLPEKACAGRVRNRVVAARTIALPATKSRRAISMRWPSGGGLRGRMVALDRRRALGGDSDIQ